MSAEIDRERDLLASTVTTVRRNEDGSVVIDQKHQSVCLLESEVEQLIEMLG